VQNIAVVHLVRRQNGLAPLERFLNSYRTHSAGVPHDLAFIFKGFSSSSDLEPYDRILTDLPHRRQFISDWGYDLRPYFETVKQLKYDYFFFLNSFSRILAPNWLALLASWAQRKGVGIAGATGSCESFATNSRLRKEMLRRMSFLERTAWRARYVRRAPALGTGLLRAVAWLLGDLKIWDPIYFFPFFPNYHIRTNAFMASREVLLRLKVSPVLTKLSAYLVESGRNSVTSQVMRAGLRAIVVGQDGQGFEPESWHKSNTFRQGHQENLLVSDNQTEAYAQAGPAVREELSRLTWGEHSRPA